MKLLITGATGLVGAAFVNAYKDKHVFGFVGRDKAKIQCRFSSISHESFDWHELKARGTEIVSQYDVVINLAGENIGAKRWSDSQKRKIIESRVESTRLIAEIVAKCENPKPRILNASAIGVYGFAGDIARQNKVFFDEWMELDLEADSFLAQVGVAWENALRSAEAAGASVTKMRFGVVLSKKGGALAKMLPSFKFGMGAVLGSGKQPFSWIGLNDLVRAIAFLLDHPELSGPINLVAPDVVSQKQFAKTLASVLKRPCFMTMPACVIKVLFGEMGEELLLNGQSVSCDHLLQAGYRFDYPKLYSALRHELG